MSAIRHDWYQTDTKVVITVLLKQAIEKNYNVKIEKNHVRMTADDYELDLELYQPINVEKSSHKATPFKVEINLFKMSGARWESLEPLLDKTSSEMTKPKNIGRHDWDKLANEIDKNDADSNKTDVDTLFRKIYSESNDDVKRAMNKSFSESGGTVLSTNWKDVGESRVEVKAPDGTEFRKWDS